MEIIYLIVLFGSILYFNSKIDDSIEEKNLKKMAKKYVDNIPVATVHNINSELYLFVDRNNKFLGQAKTIDDLAKECWEVFKEPVVKIQYDKFEDPDIDYYFITGEVMENPEITIEVKDRQ